MQWDEENAHVFIAENRNGVIKFLDPQKGITNVGSYFTKAQNGCTLCQRIDGYEPSPLILECCKNKGA